MLEFHSEEEQLLRRCKEAVAENLSGLFGKSCDRKISLNNIFKRGVKKFLLDNTYGLLTKCVVKMAGYWPSSFFACLWTETKSRSINSQKKNKANIQAS